MTHLASKMSVNIHHRAQDDIFRQTVLSDFSPKQKFFSYLFIDVKETKETFTFEKPRPNVDQCSDNHHINKSTNSLAPARVLTQD